jgi:hypothetical protein
VLDADGEEGVLGDVADCSAPEADAHEAVLDADGDPPWSGGGGVDDVGRLAAGRHDAILPS